METQPRQPEDEPVSLEEEPVSLEEEAVEEVVQDEPVAEEPFTIEKGKERAAEAVGRVRQASKEVTTQPLLDAIGTYFTRGVDALIGLADGMSGKREKKDRE